MTQKTRTIFIAIFLLFLSAANVVFFLKLSSEADETMSLRLAIAAVIAVIIVPLTLYAGFRYMPKKRWMPVLVVVVVGGFSLQAVIPKNAFLSVLVITIAFIVVICAGIFWPSRDSASTESRS